MFRRSSKNEQRRSQVSDAQDDITFRRSRTLQGTTSPVVKTTQQPKKGLASERLKNQQSKKRRRRLTLTLVFIGLSVVFVSQLYGQYIREINTITFEPASKHQPVTDRYKDTIWSYLYSQPAERLSFSLNKDHLTQYAQQQYPEVKFINKVNISNGVSDFTVTLRKPVASWQNGTTRSFVDAEGVSFAKNYFDNPKVTIVDNSGIATDGKAVVSEGFLRFLGRMIAYTNESGLGEVVEASIPKGTTREIDIKIKDRNFFVKTHIDRDPAQTVEDMKRVVGYLDNKKQSVSYIDVRISGRAFYK